MTDWLTNNSSMIEGKLDMIIEQGNILFEMNPLLYFIILFVIIIPTSFRIFDRIMSTAGETAIRVAVVYFAFTHFIK